MITIKNKQSNLQMIGNIVYKKGIKHVKFLGVTLKLDGRIFNKYWTIVK